VKLEEQLLPHPDLAGLYEKAVWLYAYRTFEWDDADRAAERVSIRLGVTSWPQLLLVDPVTLRVAEDAGRTVESFARAFAKAQLPVRPDAATVAVARNQLAEAESKARVLETSQQAETATRLLDDPTVTDRVVRMRALEATVLQQPSWVAFRAKVLLTEPSDAFRYLVCQVLAEHPDASAKGALEALVRDPRDSRNPNVLRIRAVQALAACGDAGSVAAIEPHAASGAYFNGLTGVAVDALAAIARRDATAREDVRAALRRAYPEPPTDGETRALKACVALARRVHAALASELPFPETYDAKARAALVAGGR
jgi:hypothetical protein